MGNNKFKLSDMIPNAWFYKLKDMSRVKNQKINTTTTHSTKKNPKSKSKSKPTSSLSLSPSPSSFSSLASSKIAASAQPPKPDHHQQQQPHHLCQKRKSYHFSRPTNPNLSSTRFLVDPPRKSSKKDRRSCSRANRAPPPRMVSAGCSCNATLAATKPDSTPENYPVNSRSSNNDSLLAEFGSSDIMIDMVNDQKPKFSNPTPEIDLPAITAKPESRYAKPEKMEGRNPYDDAYGSLTVKIVKEESLATEKHRTTTKSPVRRISANSPGMRLRTNSPRIASRKIQSHRSRSLSESCAVVKTSRDPQRDFKESMVEMIMENNIRASKDLEELLACYLSLNSDEYHGLIIKVFKQIWFDVTNILK